REMPTIREPYEGRTCRRYISGCHCCRPRRCPYQISNRTTTTNLYPPPCWWTASASPAAPPLHYGAFSTVSRQDVISLLRPSLQTFSLCPRSRETIQQRPNPCPCRSCTSASQ